MYGGLFVAGGTGVVVFRGILNKKNMKSQAAKAKRIAAVSVASVVLVLALVSYCCMSLENFRSRMSKNFVQGQG